MHNVIYLGTMLINLDMSDLWDHEEQVCRFFACEPGLHKWLKTNILSFNESKVSAMTEPFRTYDEVHFYLPLEDHSEEVLWKLRPDDLGPTNAGKH